MFNKIYTDNCLSQRLSPNCVHTRALRLMKHLNGKFRTKSNADLPPELFEAIGKDFGLDAKRLMADTQYTARRYGHTSVIPSYELKTLFLWDLYGPTALDRAEPQALTVVSTLIRWLATLGTRYNVDKGRFLEAVASQIPVTVVRSTEVTFARTRHFFFNSPISSVDVAHSTVKEMTDVICSMIGYIESLGIRTADTEADDPWVMFYKT